MPIPLNPMGIQISKTFHINCLLIICKVILCHTVINVYFKLNLPQLCSLVGLVVKNVSRTKKHNPKKEERNDTK